MILSVIMNVEHLDQLRVRWNMNFLGILTAIAELLSGVLVDLLVVELSVVCEERRESINFGGIRLAKIWPTTFLRTVEQSSQSTGRRSSLQWPIFLSQESGANLENRKFSQTFG